MDGWMDGCMHGRMGGWKGGWVDGKVEGRLGRCLDVFDYSLVEPLAWLNFSQAQFVMLCCLLFLVAR